MSAAPRRLPAWGIVLIVLGGVAFIGLPIFGFVAMIVRPPSEYVVYERAQPSACLIDAHDVLISVVLRANEDSTESIASVQVSSERTDIGRVDLTAWRLLPSGAPLSSSTWPPPAPSDGLPWIPSGESKTLVLEVHFVEWRWVPSTFRVSSTGGEPVYFQDFAIPDPSGPCG